MYVYSTGFIMKSLHTIVIIIIYYSDDNFNTVWVKRRCRSIDINQLVNSLSSNEMFLLIFL